MHASISTPYQGNLQAEFWTWFQENEARIWNFDRNQEKVIKLVTDAIHKVDPGLAFEIGAVDETGKREFVLSADGVTSNIPKVESLFLSAPELPRWRVIKYRPRLLAPDLQIVLSGKKVSVNDIRFQVFNDGDRIGILLMFADYSAANRDQFVSIGFLFLDRVLGEYDVMTRVGFIDFAGPESNFFKDARRLPELPKAFDEYFKPH